MPLLRCWEHSRKQTALYWKTISLPRFYTRIYRWSWRSFGNVKRQDQLSRHYIQEISTWRSRRGGAVAEADADKDSINESEETTIGNTAKPSKWLSDAQIQELVDTLFLPVEPNINEVYAKDCLSTKEILDIISSYLPDKIKSQQCSAAGVAVETLPSWRSRIKHTKARSLEGNKKGRESCMCSTQSTMVIITIVCSYFLSWLMKNVTRYCRRINQGYLIDYQAELQDLKKQGIQVIGYARKSAAAGAEDKNDDQGKRIQLLQYMEERLQQQSRVERIFVSPICNSKSSIFSRDMPRPVEMISKLENIDGTCQGNDLQASGNLFNSN